LESPTEELVQRSLKRDTRAFAQLVGQYERCALAVAYALLGDAEAAGDVAQEAFWRAWQRLAELKEPARFAAWLCGIVRNLAIDHRRRQRQPPPVPMRLVRQPVEELLDAELGQQMDAALASLDETSRLVVVLRYYQGLSSKQIAPLLDLSAAAVDMRLSRAREALRARLAGVAEEC
jgi:RNA polymerase sigma factor (sigma-70 family)